MHAHSCWKGRGLLAVLGLIMGGCTQASTEPVGVPPAPRARTSEAQAVPRITSTFQSDLRAFPGSRVTFRVVANDPQSRSLSITWTANTGTLGTPVAEASQSEVEWTPSPCVLTGTTPSITATVTNAQGLSASTTFTLSGASACLAGGALPRAPRILALQSESVAWNSR
ncbi:Ig-like domain-containing protein [Hyalangium versicolor]|uniref:Ig-like domain-containing protein n=1 Tax=Hyalangium versicolor TaxID=2861190 RepID=UPI001CC99047|nr:hypothetical protein [Hyalangium versicolor]